MDLPTQKRVSAGIGTLGLVLAVVVGVLSGIAGFMTGLGAARASAPPAPVVQRPWTAPVTAQPRQTTGPTITNGDPHWLEDPEALASLPVRLRQATSFTGRYKALIFSDQIFTGLVEVEGHGVDSVVFSWGATIVNPVPLSPADQASLEGQLFEMSEAQLRALPGIVDRLIEDHPAGTTVGSLTIIDVIAPPRILVDLAHPRVEFEQIVLDLDGRPLPY